jgi:ferrous iron transport protein A
MSHQKAVPPSSIFDLPAGETVTLSSLEGDVTIAERLMDMGLHPGVQIELVGRLPLGGPLVIRIESSFLALREEEAQCLKIKT